MSRTITRFSSLNNTLEQGCTQIMNINSGANVEKTEIINKLLEEVYRFVADMERQVREDLHGFKQGIETEDNPRVEGQICGSGEEEGITANKLI